ncbi:MAG: DUF6751 family protein [Anaerolineaceae bacterium]|nr:DUF6751 family protein [Anaerolineaceae bacterium]
MYAPFVMTWYARVGTTSTYTRTFVREVMWQSSFGVRIVKGGSITSDTLVIYVPYELEDGTWRGSLGIKTNDVLLKGEILDEITPTFTLSALQAKYRPNYFTVTNVDPKDYGSAGLQHDRIGAK